MKNKTLHHLLMITKYGFYGFLIQLAAITLLLADGLSAQQYQSVREKRIDIQLKQADIQQTFKTIEKKTEYLFQFDDKIVDPSIKINFSGSSVRVSDLLMFISEKAGLQFKQMNNSISVSRVDSNARPKEIEVLIQTRSVSGKVVSLEDDESLPGVNIVEKGTSNGTVTNLDGEYNLTVSENATLVFSSVGFTTEEIQVGNQSVINLGLTPDIQQLQELVVVGYGTQRKGELTVAVSQVKGEELESIPKTNILETLGGRAAGVDVVTPSGAPGAQSTIRIRGANSVNSNASPLVVIDGFPIAAAEGDLFEGSRMGISGSQTDLLSMINPNDIESIEFLKDAAATSIYGSRGANGVVLITTKSGREGKSEITFSANTGIHRVANQWEMMNANEFSNLLYDAYERGGIDMQNLAFNPSGQQAIPAEYNTQWLDEIMRTGQIQDYNISFSGGNSNSNFSGSVGYLDNQGIIKSNYYKRYSARLNGEATAWNDKITFGANANISYVDQKTLSDGRVYNRAMQMPPNYPLRYPEGTEYAGYYTHSNSVVEAWDVLWGNNYGVASSNALTLQNPFLDIDVAQVPTNLARMILNGYASLEPIKGLTLKTSAGTDLNYSKMKFLIQSEGPYRPTGASLEHKQNQTYSWLIENTMTYRGAIGNHTFTALLGQSSQKFYREGLGIAVEENDPGNILVGNDPFFVDGWYFNNGVHDHLTDSHKYAEVGEWTVASYFGRFNYSYDERYLLTATLRRDGSSKFGEDNKWGTFPGVSAAWNLHNEDFFNLNNVNQLKFRGSWGVVGNGNIPSFQSLSLLRSIPSIPIGVVIAGTSTFENGLVDPALSWESTREIDFGIDAFIFNKFNITTDVYWKKTYDLLYGFALPESTGFSSIATTNLGSLNQFGFEFAISGDILNAGDLNWFGTLNLNHISGKVTELPPNTDWVGNQIRSYLNEPIGTIYGYEVDGIYNSTSEVEDPNNPYPNAQPGDYRYRDLGGVDENGEFVMTPDGNITGADRVDLGNVMPVVSFGFNNNFTYKDFDLNVFLRSSLGNKIYNQAKRELLDTDGDRNTIKEAVNRWTPQNQSQTIQAANSNRNNPTGNAPISIFVEDGSYLRLANLTFGYSLSPDALTAIGIKQLRIYTTMNNLFVLTGYSGLDPEIGGGDALVPRGIDTSTYPRIRTYSLGLNVKF